MSSPVPHQVTLLSYMPGDTHASRSMAVTSRLSHRPPAGTHEFEPRASSEVLQCRPRHEELHHLDSPCMLRLRATRSCADIAAANLSTPRCSPSSAASAIKTYHHSIAGRRAQDRRRARRGGQHRLGLPYNCRRSGATSSRAVRRSSHPRILALGSHGSSPSSRQSHPQTRAESPVFRSTSMSRVAPLSAMLEDLPPQLVAAIAAPYRPPHLSSPNVPAGCLRCPQAAPPLARHFAPSATTHSPTLVREPPPPKLQWRQKMHSPLEPRHPRTPSRAAMHGGSHRQATACAPHSTSLASRAPRPPSRIAIRAPLFTCTTTSTQHKSLHSPAPATSTLAARPAWWHHHLWRRRWPATSVPTAASSAYVEDDSGQVRVRPTRPDPSLENRPGAREHLRLSHPKLGRDD